MIDLFRDPAFVRQIMEKKIVKNFEHYSGVHCESTALRGVFAVYAQ